jgi:hypothetical protein
MMLVLILSLKSYLKPKISPMKEKTAVINYNGRHIVKEGRRQEAEGRRLGGWNLSAALNPI